MSHHDHRHGPHAHHAHPADDARDALGNPVDLARYLERLEGPERAEWQRPDDVVAALRLQPGARVCDVGAGAGYFTLRLARAVGPTGKVFAIEAEPRMVDVLRTRLEEHRIENVHTTLATDGAGLPPEPVDRVLIVNAYHHFSAGPAYLRALAGVLRPGGTIVNVESARRPGGGMRKASPRRRGGWPLTRRGSRTSERGRSTLGPSSGLLRTSRRCTRR